MRRYFNEERRRRLAPILLLLGLLVVGQFAKDEVPRDQEVRLLLSPSQQEAETVRVVYAQDGEDVTGVDLRYPDGAPREVVHTPSLRPGNYHLGVELRYRDGRVEHVERSLAVPSEGGARVRLAPPPR